MTNSTQTTPQPESKKEIPELSLEQLQQVSGGMTVWADRKVAPPKPAMTVWAD